MNPAAHSVDKAVDHIQQRLASYAYAMRYADLPPPVVHAAKLRIIDTLGALFGGFFGEPCRIARDLAARMPYRHGATVIGTGVKTTPDMAAFANATTSRCAELMDVYHWPGSFESHPSDTVTPVLAAAEHAHADGRGFITGVVLAYEVYSRISDVFTKGGFDHTNFGCVATATAAGKLLGLTTHQLAHCISMAVVPNNMLRQARHASMFKAAAAGQAGRAGVFAALLARAGMEGPHLPFEGRAGWCDHVARIRFSLDELGGDGITFKILHSFLKNRPAAGIAIASMLAAEKIAPLDCKNVRQIIVEVHGLAKERVGSDHAGNPDSREAADHSIPYLVAATLRDGTVTLRSFDDVHLRNPQLRDLMAKTSVVENIEFTHDYERIPQANRARITVVTADSGKLEGVAGGDADDLSAPRSDAQVTQKFRSLTEDILGVKRVDAVLDRLWNLDDINDVAVIPPAVNLD